MSGARFLSQVSKTANIDKRIDLAKLVDIIQVVDLTGVVADAEAIGDVRFPSTNDGVTVETFAEVQIEIGTIGLNSAEAFSQALAAFRPGGAPVSFSIGDFLWADLNENGQQDPGEPGVDAGATVLLFADVDGDGAFDDFVASDTTNAQGGYRFAGLEAGTYQLQFPDPTEVTYNDGQPLSSFTARNPDVDNDRDSDADPLTGRSPTVTVGPSTSAVDAGYVAPAAVVPGIEIVKTADRPSVSALGEVITYTIEVTNIGSVPLTESSLTDTVESDPATDLSGSFSGDDGNGVLDVGETWTYTNTYEVTQADLDGDPARGTDDGDIDNVAAATFLDPSNNPVDGQDVESVTIVADATLAIDKVFLGVTNPLAGLGGDNFINEAGDVINYQVAVTNTGNVTLINVSIVDPLANINMVIGSLAPGETSSVLGTYTVTQEDIADNGGGDAFIDNTATADSDQTDPPMTDSEAVPIANLAIEKRVAMVGSSEIIMAGDVINYIITVSNIGAVDLTNVTVRDDLSELDAALGALAAGAVVELETTYAVTQADIDSNGGGDGTIDNTASATSPETGDRIADASVPIERLPLVSISKNVAGIANPNQTPGGSIVDEAGDVITYTIEVSNPGNVTLADVSVIDALSALNENIGELSPGESVLLQTTYTVSQDDIDSNGGGDGAIDNVATASGEDPVGDPNGDITDSDSASVPIQGNADIAIDKSVVSINGDPNRTFVNQAGDEISYAITVSNPGTISLTDVVVDDSRVTDLVFEEGDDDNDNELDPSEVWRFSGRTIVSADDLTANGAINNTATANSNEAGPVSDSASVPIVVEVNQLNVVFIIDASGSTDDTWAWFSGTDPDGELGLPEFQGFDQTDYFSQQNPPITTDPFDDPMTVNEAGDIIDAQIAAFKNLTESIIDQAASHNIDDVQISVIKVFNSGAAVSGMFDPTTNKDDLFENLESTGSDRSTNLGRPMELAFNLFADGSRQGPDDLNVLYFLSDGVSDNIVNNPSIASQVAAMDALANVPIREAWHVQNVEGTGDADNPINDPFSQIDNTGGVEELTRVANLEFDYLMA